MPKKAPTERPYIIRMSSQKGGVGKTTIAVNLSTALSVKGYRVLLVDADIYNPCITFYLGLRSPTVGFKDVLLGKSKLEKSDILYSPQASTSCQSPKRRRCLLLMRNTLTRLGSNSTKPISIL
jgi:MinD superfamily P-loop ATPase